MLRIRLATTLAALALVTACSSADPTGDRLGGGTQDDTGNGNSSSTNGSPAKTSGSTSTNNGNTTTTQNPTTPAPTNPTNPTTPAPTGDPAKCGAEQTFDACMSCCTGGNQAALKVADDAYVACMCQTPGACSAQCGGSFCTGQQPTQACETCLGQNDQSCGQQADTACAANTTCKPALDCVVAASCDQKQ